MWRKNKTSTIDYLCAFQSTDGDSNTSIQNFEYMIMIDHNKMRWLLEDENHYVDFVKT